MKKWVEEALDKARDLGTYDVGETVEALASRLGKKPSEILKLNSNENLFISLELLRDILRQSLEEIDPRIYPKEDYVRLKRAIGEFMNVPEECVVIGAGSDYLIELISRIFLKGGDEALSINPTFAIYEKCVRIQGATYRSVPLRDDFSLDIDRMLSAMTQRTKLIFLCSPNNPTANRFEREAILHLASKFDGPILIDEAYADFSGVTLANEAADSDNLIVSRTFSKTFGLAGLRIGYLIANERIARTIEEKFQLPYPVSTVALKAALKMIGKWDEVSRAIDAIKAERKNLINALNGINGVRAFPSETNFVLFQVSKNSSTVYKNFLEKGIIVRNIGRVLKFDNCLRVTVAPRQIMKQFIEELRDIMES